MKILKISNSKLVIIETLSVNIKQENQNQVVYKFMVNIDGDNTTFIKPGESTSGSGKNYYIGKAIEKAGTEKYTADQLYLIMRMLSVIPVQYVKLNEILVLATKDENSIKSFYGNYGSNYSLFQKQLRENALSGTYTPSLTTRTYSRQYRSEKRYSVYTLLKDLLEDNAKIFINSELLGKYKRITASKRQIPSEVKYTNDSWYQITGIIGNKTRANLSLRFKGSVDIDIPVNNFGVTPGVITLETPRTINIIKDGQLNTTSIGVRVSGKLAKKLRGTKCIDMELLYNNDFLLDLTKLPVISKTEIGQITGKMFCQTLLKAQLYSAGSIYKDYQKNGIPVKGQKKQLTPKEQFLRSLGIYGKTYVAVNEKQDWEGTGYSMTELISKSVSGMPGNSSISSCVSKFIRIGKSGYPVLDRFLSSLTGVSEKDVNSLKNKYLDQYRDLVFRLILGKTGNFNGYKNPKATDTNWKLEYGDNPCINAKESVVYRLNYKESEMKI